MSGGTLGQGAVYSPLAQYISDSDTSEEELHSTIPHLNNHASNRKTILSPKFTVKDHNGQSMGDYRPFGNEDAGYASVNGIPRQHSPTRDDVRILKPDGDQRSSTPMGPVRRAFFIFSIAMCFFTVIVFLWVLPCDMGVCPETCRKSSIKSWERILNRLELKGSISVVPGAEGRGRNLVFMGRCKVVNDSSSTADPDEVGTECGATTEGGLISLVGSDGSVAWWKPLRGLPRETNCSLVDVNRDGVEDCLVVGGRGLMAVVDPISGTMLWRLPPGDQPSLAELTFPLILPDLDGDGVNELLTSSGGHLLLVSGGTGRAMTPPYAIPSCIGLRALTLGRRLDVSYTCIDAAGSESVRETPLRSLYAAIANNSLEPLSLTPRQHESLARARSISEASRMYAYAVGGRTLTLENRGRCPRRCEVSVRVTGLSGETVWNYTAENTYAMVPATLLFANLTLANGSSPTEPVSGFVLKFWQWNYVIREDLRSEGSGTSSNPLFRSRLRRSPLPPSPDAHLLRERVVLVTFNATDMHIVNASQNDVTQLCVRETVCQPDLAFQEQSLLIADLDQDGSQELVSYYTTYVSSGPDEMSGPWRLQSKIRAIRLEAELPKLYEAVARQ